MGGEVKKQTIYEFLGIEKDGDLRKIVNTGIMRQWMDGNNYCLEIIESYEDKVFDRKILGIFTKKEVLTVPKSTRVLTVASEYVRTLKKGLIGYIWIEDEFVHFVNEACEERRFSLWDLWTAKSLGV